MAVRLDCKIVKEKNSEIPPPKSYKFANHSSFWHQKILKPYVGPEAEMNVDPDPQHFWEGE